MDIEDQKNTSDGTNRGKSQSQNRDGYVPSIDQFPDDPVQIQGSFVPLRMLIVLIVGIVAAEVIAMIIVYYNLMLPYYLLVIVDIAIITIIVIPLLYFFSVRPLLQQTQRRQLSERIIQSRLRLMQFANEHSLEELLEFSLNEIETMTGSRVSFFHFLEGDQKTISLRAWSTNTLKNMCSAEGKGSHYDLEQAGVWADAVRQRKPVIHNNYATLANRKGLPEGHAQIIRELVVPILRDNKVLAIIGLGNKLHDYTTSDVGVVSTFADFAWDIVEHKLSVDAIYKREEKFRTLVDWTYDWELWLDEQGNIAYCSPSSEHISGYIPEEFIADPKLLLLIVHPDDKQVMEDHQKVNQDPTAGPMMMEYRIITRDGSEHWIEHICRPLFGSDNQYLGRRISNRDITKRKQADMQLSILNIALEAAANAIVITDHQGEIQWANSAFATMTGYPFEEVKNMNPRFLKSGMQDQEFYRNLWETILAGKVWHAELVNRRKNGSLYHEDQTITPVLDQSGNIVNFISIRQDITEHKQAEDALRKREEQYRSLVIATTQIVWQTNADGVVVEDLPMWRAYTGQTEQELLGRGWINALHPADQQRTAEIWSHAVETKTPYDTEYRIRSHTGEYGYFGVRGVPTKDENGNISGWIGTCTDITEKKNVENQLVQAEKHAVIGRMVGSVTHEINNPLQTIKNCLYLISQDTGSDSPNREPLEMALSETQRLGNIVGQLRQLYRPQASQTMVAQELLSIIGEVHALIIPHLNNSKVVWRPLPGLQDCKVFCAKEQLIEVFLNLSTNAIDSMQPAGGELSVDMDFNTAKGKVGVIFRDTGPGISSEILSHIFEPFMTTKEYGLGLGLSICYGIIQKHGGQITVESQPGQGTSFTVWLPLVAIEEENGG